MRGPSMLVVIVSTTMALVAGSANALVCYVVLDRSDNVVYRDLEPPVDMSAQSVAGTAARDKLRQAGEFLYFFTTDRCPPVSLSTASGRGRPATIEEIIAVIPTIGSPGAGTGAPVTGFRSGPSSISPSAGSSSTSARSSPSSTSMRY